MPLRWVRFRRTSEVTQLDSVMSYAKFLDRVIDDGITSARLSYVGPTNEMKLNGSLSGFTACRGLTPYRLDKLKKKADATANHCRMTHDPEYWFWTCRAAEIEWVCNVVSAALYIMKLPVIFHPTVRATQKASSILGIRAVPEEERWRL